jgi:glycosyltransferase involved in cell wall biosynthesis
VLSWMCAADGFVLSSRWEGLPIALLEAGACRLPVVVTDIPGVWEVMHEWRHDQVAPVGDVEALAARMQATMCLPEKERHDLGASLHGAARERFSLNAVLDQWENLYNHHLKCNPQPSRFGTAAHSPRRTLQLQ